MTYPAADPALPVILLLALVGPVALIGLAGLLFWIGRR